ncbi:hypothetical protein KUCAC02_019334, partial [Chaenocephalus aceratus]
SSSIGFTRFPGKWAMLNTTLASYDVFNISAVPYNITWYDSKTRQEISNETGRTARTE